MMAELALETGLPVWELEHDAPMLEALLVAHNRRAREQAREHQRAGMLQRLRGGRR